MIKNITLCFIYQSKYKNTSILTNSKVWVSELAPHSPHNLVQKSTPLARKDQAERRSSSGESLYQMASVYTYCGF